MRSQLRVADLKRRTKSMSKVINVRVPGQVFEAIDELTKRLRATKTDVIAALLKRGVGRRGKEARRASPEIGGLGAERRDASWVQRPG